MPERIDRHQRAPERIVLHPVPPLPAASRRRDLTDVESGGPVGSFGGERLCLKVTYVEILDVGPMLIVLQTSRVRQLQDRQCQIDVDYVSFFWNAR
jgi:hypothetical protein